MRDCTPKLWAKINHPFHILPLPGCTREIRCTYMLHTQIPHFVYALQLFVCTTWPSWPDFAWLGFPKPLSSLLSSFGLLPGWLWCALPLALRCVHQRTRDLHQLNRAFTRLTQGWPHPDLSRLFLCSSHCLLFDIIWACVHVAVNYYIFNNWARHW